VHFDNVEGVFLALLRSNHLHSFKDASKEAGGSRCWKENDHLVRGISQRSM
jgi:hypothetical protein